MAYIYRTALFQRWIFGNGDIDTLFGHNEAQIEFPLHSRPRVMIQSRQASRPIVDVSTADPPLAFARCARSRAISALWTSLVAWSSTVLTFWFVEPEVQALQKFFRLLLYFLHTARSREKPRGACLARVHIEARTAFDGPARAHAATFERSLCHLALVTLCGRSCLASARWAFSVRPFCQTSTINGRTMNGNARTFVR